MKEQKPTVKEFLEKFLNPYVAAQLDKINKIIEPKDTRKALINALSMLTSKMAEVIEKRRKYKHHGNMPV